VGCCHSTSGGVLTAWPEKSDGWLSFEGSSAEQQGYAVDCLASSKRSFGAAVGGQVRTPDACAHCTPLHFRTAVQLAQRLC
jgi:hypothetical protein